MHRLKLKRNSRFTFSWVLTFLLTHLFSCASPLFKAKSLIGVQGDISLSEDKATNTQNFAPLGKSKNTTIVILHGSEGGADNALYLESALLAGRGYKVVLFCYFDCSRGRIDPRETLFKFDLSILQNLIIRLRSEMDGNSKLAIFGISRGAELALLYSSSPELYKEQPDLLVLHAPSPVVFQAVNLDWYRNSCWVCSRNVPDCLSAGASKNRHWNPACGKGDVNEIDTSLSPWVTKGQHLLANSRIPSELFRGPVLITVGRNDQIWPAHFSEQIRNERNASGLITNLEKFPEEGHELSLDARKKRIEIIDNFLQQQAQNRGPKRCPR